MLISCAPHPKPDIIPCQGEENCSMNCSISTNFTCLIGFTVTRIQQVTCCQYATCVRFPPAPPLYRCENSLVNPHVFSVYLWCTFRFQNRYRILFPNALQILIKLLLPSAYPRRVVPLGYPNTLVPKEHRDMSNRNTPEEKRAIRSIPGIFPSGGESS
jgi:hypothetical protein